MSTNTVKNKFQETVATGADKAKDMASTVADKAKDAASSVSNMAKDAASSVGNMAEKATTAVGERANEAVTSVGGGMKSLAGTIRDKGPHSGILGSATSTVADTLESSGRYLEKEGLSGIAEDMTGLIRRNPLPAVLVGIGLGFLLARATRS